MAQRVVMRTRKAYNTRSNRRQVTKTPGNQLVYLYKNKRTANPKCGDCGSQLPGIPALRSRSYATVSKRQKSVSRAYGGSRCATCTRDRIVRAFLVEEAKIVKKVMKNQAAKK